MMNHRKILAQLFFGMTFITIISSVLLAQETTQNTAQNADATEMSTVYVDPAWERDWYSPAPDWRAAMNIREYTVNTRIPELIWVRYEGAYTQGLRIRPLSATMLEKQIEAKLIDPKNAETALEFQGERERNERFRTVRVSQLKADIPNVTAVSFKMKAVTRNAGANLKLNTGFGVIDTADAKFLDKETRCSDGFKAYRLEFGPRKEAKLNDISITVDAMNGNNAQQEFVIIDLVYHLTEKMAVIHDLPPRAWAVDDGKKPIGGVYEYMNSTPTDAGVEIRDLPITGWTPRDGQKDRNVQVKTVKVKLPKIVKPEVPEVLEVLDEEKVAENGENAENTGNNPENAENPGAETVAENKTEVKPEIKPEVKPEPEKEVEVDAVQFTITKGDRAYWICPVKMDGLKFHTMSFLYKIEVPGGCKTLGDANPPTWGWPAGEFHKYFDNFGVNYLSATRDIIDWSGYGVTRAGAAWNRQRDEKVEDGWNVFAWDAENDDMTGNKDSSREAVTHWTIYYDSSKIPEGQKVVITIANPKIASGIMRTGGDMEKFRAFKASFAKRKYDYSDSRKYLNPPTEGRLVQPIPVMKENIFDGEIVVCSDWGGSFETRQYAAEELRRLIQLVVAPMNDVPILRSPTDRDNVKFFVGGWNQCKTLTDEQKKAFQEDMKAVSETPGCAIRTVGKNIFMFGGQFRYTPKAEMFPGIGRGTISAVYLFMENNTDMILAGYNSRNNHENRDYVFTRPRNGSWSVTWGDGLFIPPAKSWFISGAGSENTSRSFGTRGDWHINYNEALRGMKRNKSVNHWFGWGARDKNDPKKPNEKWGLGEDGQRMYPDCYTGHPCLINVLEDAKIDYVESGMEVVRNYGDQERRYYEIVDMIALWLEDTLKICVCDKCTAPIRLPDGSLVKIDEIDFRSTQFHAQTSAMIQAWNVYVDPGQLCETIAYFWEMPIPRCPISRQIQPRICPYVRKNYKVPIYAPINDSFWRQMVRWGQVLDHLAIYEYYLGVNFRPWTDVNQYDLLAELEIGIRNGLCYEGESGKASAMERWVLGRQLWNPEADPIQLRKYYIRRTYREAAPDMEKFYFRLQESYYQDPGAVEFEESDRRMAQWALWTPSPYGGTLADELTGYLDRAQKNVRHPVAKQYVEEIRTLWLEYVKAAKEEKAKVGIR
ncbi:MAG: DUF4838 domain-containing protein [Planctomycetia bacterium]|nr:DUF4838 domain-containing protein [Planctomycetia bacterium]